MSRPRVRVRSIAIAGLFALWVPSAHAAESETPDATLEFTGTSVAIIFGYAWGSGTLTYKGVKYPIKLAYLSAGSVGATSMTGSGKVYNLKTLEDFEGNYAAASAAATVGGGGGFTAMRNQRGVFMQIVSTSQGLDLSLAAQGVNMKLAE